jgi:hypothetical protein
VIAKIEWHPGELYPSTVSAVRAFSGVPISIYMTISKSRWRAFWATASASEPAPSRSLLAIIYFKSGEGNDKGKVESLVKYSRANFLTPVPHAASFYGLNAALEERCCARQDRARRSPRADKWQKAYRGSSGLTGFALIRWMRVKGFRFARSGFRVVQPLESSNGATTRRRQDRAGTREEVAGLRRTPSNMYKRKRDFDWPLGLPVGAFARRAAPAPRWS